MFAPKPREPKPHEGTADDAISKGMTSLGAEVRKHFQTAVISIERAPTLNNVDICISNADRLTTEQDSKIRSAANGLKIYVREFRGKNDQKLTPVKP